MDLLGRWDQGEDPSVAEMKRAWIWSWDKAAALFAEMRAWAIEAGARLPPEVPSGKIGSESGGNRENAGRPDVGSTPATTEQSGERREAIGSESGASCARVPRSRQTETTEEEIPISPPAAQPAPAPAPDPTPEPVKPPRPKPPDDALTLWTVYRQHRLDLPLLERVVGRAARPTLGLTPTPANRKALGVILTEAGSAERAAVYLAWVHQAGDLWARRLRGEAPWPDGDVTVRLDAVSLGRSLPGRLAEADAWDARGRCDAPEPYARGAPPGRPPQRDGTEALLQHLYQMSQEDE